MAEAIAVIRDIVIIVWAVLGIVAFLALIFVAFGIYRAAKPILHNLRGTTGDVRATTRMVSDAVIKPAIPVISFYTGVRQGAQTLRRFMKWRGK